MASCPRCDDTGVVCERHPKMPWGGMSDAPEACNCGANGKICPDCDEGAEMVRYMAEVVKLSTGATRH
jgi:hypothetical protein